MFQKIECRFNISHCFVCQLASISLFRKVLRLKVYQRAVEHGGGVKGEGLWHIKGVLAAEAPHGLGFMWTP